MPVTKLVVNLLIRSKLLISTTRFGEQAGVSYWRCGRTKAPYNGMKNDCEKPWKKRLIRKFNRLASFSVLAHRADRYNLLTNKR